jgi:WD40 repeat protein
VGGAHRRSAPAVSLHDPATGKLLRELSPGGGTVVGFVVAPTGRDVGGWVRRDEVLTFVVWDAATGRRRDVFTTDPTDDPCAVFLGDGGRVAHRVFSVDEAGRVPDWDKIGWYVRDATTGKVVRTLRVVPGEGAEFSPDGAVHYYTQFGVVTPLRVATGAAVSGPDPPGLVHLARFTADGRLLAVGREWGTGAHQLLGWDPRTGRLVSRGHRFKPDQPTGLAMIGDASPDGGRVAVLGRAAGDDPFTLHVCDAATGAVRATVPPGDKPGENVRFSADGRRVYTADPDGKNVRAWDAATGRRIADPGPGSFRPAKASTSPDGRMRAEPDDAAGVRLVEAATGGVRHTFGGHAMSCHDFAFSPDGRYLAADSGDAPILVWDVRGELSRPAPPDAMGLAAAWADLASDDAAAGFRAVRLLAHFPDRAVPFLRDKLQPATGPAAEEVAKLVAALDAPAFVDREKAEKELKKLGRFAGPALRKAVTATTSAEVRQRAERLLAPLAAGKLSAEQLRAVRAVEAVGWMGTPAAKALLRAWAGGAAGAPLTEEAAAAAGRD